MAIGEVFLDSSYAIALSVENDPHHSAALQFSFIFEDPRARVVTTRAVMMEIGDALSRARFREAALALLTTFEADPGIEIVPLSEELFKKAFELFRGRRDKEWGLTDCLSFVVMWERGIAEALTADRHFRQAGFRTLLEHPGVDG
jgi:predicted nucleic acid-binding protein